MIQKTKRPISILLVLLMIVGMFTVLPISAGAAEGDYYLAGWFNDWTPGDTNVKLVQNPVNSSEYMYLGMTFTKEDPSQNGFKVVSSDGNTWYPGVGDNYSIAAGTYDIYFRPDGNGGEGWHYGYIYAETHYVAQIGETKYETLAAAVEAAQDYDEITLLADCTVDSQINIDKNITIYGAGKTITCTYADDYATKGSFANGAAFQLVGNERTFAIVNATLDGNGVGTVAINAYRDNGNDNNVIDLTNVTVKNFIGYEHYGAIKLFSHAHLNATDCTFVDNALNNNTQGYAGGADIWAGGAATVYLYGTSAESVGLNGTSGGGADLTLDNNSHVAALNISIDGYNNPDVRVSLNDEDSSIGAITFKDTPEGDDARYVAKQLGALTTQYTLFKTTKVAAVDPTYDAPGNIEYYEGNDGKYYSDVAGNTEITLESTVIPALTGAVAEVNGVKYGTFAEAVTAANGEKVITLLADGPAYVMTGGETLKVAKNGFKFSVPKVEGAYLVNSATEDGVTTYTTEEASVKYTNANGGVTYYKTISSVNNGTYQLLKDITTTSYIVPGTFASDVTIDLNGHTFTSSNARSGYETAVLLSRDGKETEHKQFTIQNGKIVYTNANSPLSAVTVSGKYNDVTIKNVTIESAVCGIQVTGENQTVAISNSSITGTNDFALATNGSATKNATITVENSTLKSDGSIGVYLPGDADVTFTNSNVTGTTAMYIKGGNVTVDGGTITANGAAAEFSHNGNGANPTGDAIVVESCNYPAGVPTLTISGAPTVTSANGVQVGDYTYGEATAAEVTATSNEMSLPEGLKWVATETEGVYAVGPDYAAEVNGTGYMTFAEAAAAANGEVITLLKNAPAYVMTGGETLKVNKNGFTFAKPTVEGAYAVTSATAEGVTTYNAVPAVVKITDKNGAVSYAATFTSFNTNGTYQLLDDIEVNWLAPTIFTSDIVLDLNGHTVTAKNTSHGILLSRGGSATAPKTCSIIDTSEQKGGTIKAATSYDKAIEISGNYNEVTIGEGVIIEGCVAVLKDNDTLTVNGTINGGDDFAIATNGSTTHTATITVNDGAKVTSNVTAIYLPGTGTTTINGGEVTGATAIYQKSGTLNVNGGTITATGAAVPFEHNGNGAKATGDAIVVESCNYPGGVPTTTINGGTIASTNGKQIGDYTYGEATAAEVTATSNTLTLPEGLKWVATETEGVYEVAPDYVAQVNGSGYMTFAEAVAARTSNDDVITLIKAAGTYTSDDHTEFPIKVAKSGKSVTVKIEDAPYYVTNATADGVTTYTAVEGKVKYTAANGTVSYLGNIDYSNMSGSGTYQLLDDITANSRIAPGIFVSNITLDLNGHTLTSTASDYGILLARGGSAASPKTFDLVDTSTDKGGKLVASSADQAIAVGGKYNTVTIGEGVTVEGCVALTSENQTLTVNGTINGGNDFAIATNGSATKNATITVNDGAKVTSNVTAIYLPGTGTTTINGGEVTGATAIYQKSGTLKVNGGTITGNGAAAEFTHNGNGANATGDAIVVESCNYPGGAPTTTISGGTFVSENGKQIGDYTYGEAAAPEVTATTNTLTLPEDLKWVETQTAGVYEVAPKEYVAEVVSGNNVGKKYETVNDAIAAAGENGEVKLIADITGNVGIGGVLTPYNTTLDLNGHTITNNGGSGITLYSQYTAPATFTIKDSSPEQTGGITITKRYYGDACISDSSGRQVIIEGGNYTSDDKALYISSDEGWTINGGTFTGKIFVKSDVEITDGTFHGEVVQDSSYDYSTSPATEIPAEIAISGGTFDNPVPEDFCAEGYIPKDNGDGTYTVVPAPTQLFTGHNITLRGDVSLNFFIDTKAIENYDPSVSAKVVFTYDDGTRTAEVDFADATHRSDGVIVATIQVPAAFMAHQIHAVVYYNGVAQAETDDYSIQQYAEELIADPAAYGISSDKVEAVKTLMKEMLNYGAKAQTVFAGQVKEQATYDDLTQKYGYHMAPVTAAMIQAAIDAAPQNKEKTATDLSTVKPEENATFYTASVVFLSESTLKIVFKVPGGSTIAGEYDGSQKNTYYWVQETDIAAAQLDTLQEFTVGDATFYYSALDYAKVVLKNGNAVAQELVSALYLYNQAANVFFGADA